MGKITQMRSQKASKAKYKKPKTPAQIAAADIRKAARAADDTETDFNGCPPHRHSDLEVKSAVDGKMKVDEMVGKVNQSNARQIVDELDKQLGEMDLESPEESQHRSFMKEALSMAELALATDETPVGCVFVYRGEIIARGMNATNRTLNGTRHAEYMAISSILSPPPGSTVNSSTEFASSRTSSGPATAEPLPASVLHETDVYVTVEPCIMCASLLRQYGIRRVFFGASNDKFGGTGGVLNIHDDDVGDLKSYEVSGGWCREDAILALRKFYVQENDKAPEPRNKKERKLKTEILPYQKPATPALSTTRNKRFSKTPSTSSSVSASVRTVGSIELEKLNKLDPSIASQA